MKIRLPIRKPAPPNNKRPPKLKLKASVARSRRAPIIEDEDDFLEEPEPNMKLSHAFVVVLVLHVIAVAGVFAFNSIKARQSEIFSATKGGTAAPVVNAQTTEPAPPTADVNASAGSSNGPAAPQAGTPESTATSGAATPAPAQPVASTPAGSRTHEMAPGDTLTKVAAQYGVTIAALEKANNITDPTKIRAGTVLTVPESDGTTQAAATTSQPALAGTAPATESAAAVGDVKDSGELYTVAKGDNPVKIAKKLKVPYTELMALNGNPDPRKLQIGQKLKIPAAK